MKKEVAIKHIKFANNSKKDQLYNEFETQIGYRYSHINIIKVFEVIKRDIDIFIVMEIADQGDVF